MELSEKYASASRESRNGNTVAAFRLGLSAISDSINGEFGELIDFEDLAEGDLVLIIEDFQGETHRVLDVIDEKSEHFITLSGQSIFKGMSADYFLLGSGYPTLSTDVFKTDDETTDSGVTEI